MPLKTQAKTSDIGHLWGSDNNELGVETAHVWGRRVCVWEVRRERNPVSFLMGEKEWHSAAQELGPSFSSTSARARH